MRTGTAVGFRASHELCSNFLLTSMRLTCNSVQSHHYHRYKHSANSRFIDENCCSLLNNSIHHKLIFLISKQKVRKVRKQRLTIKTLQYSMQNIQKQNHFYHTFVLHYHMVTTFVHRKLQPILILTGVLKTEKQHFLSGVNYHAFADNAQSNERYEC